MYLTQGRAEPWKLPPHLKLLNKRLVQLERREGKRKLMVFMPPRHGKSELVSHWFPMWYLTVHPEHRFVLTSYGAEFAASWGRKTRDEMEEWGSQLWGLQVRSDSKAADRWQIAGHDGGMTTAGVGGPLTGKGANVLVIDDPLKNAEEAWSVQIQSRNLEWWQSTASTRLEPDAIVILMMTRWHQKDLAGAILEEEGDDWDVIELKAIADTGDQLGRQPGEALWPQRYDVDALAKIRKTAGPYYWDAMYQQRPRLPDGVLYFDSFAIKRGLEQAQEPRERIETRPMPGSPSDGYVDVWERPLTGQRYYIGADTADGKGEVLGSWAASGGPDRNAAAIYRASDNVQVAEIYGRQEEHQFARTLADWGRAYNNALLAVESNRRAVVVALRELRYPNLYATPRPSDLHLVMTDTRFANSIEYGWSTNVKTRPLMLSDIREATSTGAIHPKSAAFWKECQTFVVGDPPQASPGMHDDLVMAHAIAWQCRKMLGAGPAPVDMVRAV